jgi:hypothetical protein
MEGTRRASDGEGEMDAAAELDRRHPPHPDPLPRKRAEREKS